MNEELASINQRFTSNKLSLNAQKAKYSLFHKTCKRDDIPLMLTKLTISNHVIEKQEFAKFLGVLLDENLNWKYTENKIAKSLGLLYKAPLFYKGVLLIYTNLHKLCQYSSG